ncbi:uncharacterized protein Z520_05277 [Fonsecaea multimorphosa CBS 102226]|uniref:Uncharacterized protein n=1 Tax=Fonsecaea multimorphosa CBS 102226 TaxID=1442371 RepID=A0A0D2IPD2_9EURO|nr:uncharacterized protein Z520_05277 [Fonsecaea multimorphosa CBS 102226]KIX98816.1 hypothetical protein Z520_05277 [Fonsecaea multimorphosa CBS 102226]OAL25096.1 hypothetical protein AYO22_04973 [Fonsecaea multimorphosa]
MAGRLQGKVAIVTGAGQGFGKGIAAKFVEEGARVVIADLSQKLGAAAAQELKCEFALIDVTDKSQWETLLKKTIDSYGQLDIVVNNAGTTYRNKPTSEVTDADFDLCVNVNMRSIYYSTNVIVPYFQQRGRGGCFVNIASTAAIRPRPGLTWYNASKAAVITATKTLAVEYARDQIRFTCVCPVVGLGTGLTDLFLGKPENEEAFVSTVPLGRAATPKDIGNTCAYLVSDEAAFITGNAIEVDGGRCV